MTITAIRHTGIVVSSLDRPLWFYRDLLGLEVWADFEDDSEYVQAVTAVPGARLRMVKLRASDGGSIELIEYLSHPPPGARTRRSVPSRLQSRRLPGGRHRCAACEAYGGGHPVSRVSGRLARWRRQGDVLPRSGGGDCRVSPNPALIHST